MEEIAVVEERVVVVVLEVVLEMVVLLVVIEFLFGMDGKRPHLNPKNLH